MPASRDTARAQQSQIQPPRHARWVAENCPYALEMRIDLITRLKSELNQAGATGIEIGGVFFGVLPTQASPNLRIEDLIIVPAGGSGPASREFNLDPDQIKNLKEVSEQSLATGRPFVGFFRSHLRSSPLIPSREDLSMLRQLFPAGTYAFWLLGPRIKRFREAAFFLAVGGHLPGIPSSPAFPFDESTFQELREVPVEATEDIRNFDFGKAAPRKSHSWQVWLTLVVVSLLIGFWTLGSRVSEYLRPPSNKIDLAVMNVGNNLRITWDHSAPLLSQSLSATVVIIDGNYHREFKLSKDDLKFGQVSYERSTKKVYVVMSLNMQSGKVPPQTFDWTGE